MLKLDGVCKTYRVGAFGGRELKAVSDVGFEVGEERWSRSSGRAAAARARSGG